MSMTREQLLNITAATIYAGRLHFSPKDAVIVALNIEKEVTKQVEAQYKEENKALGRA